MKDRFEFTLLERIRYRIHWGWYGYLAMEWSFIFERPISLLCKISNHKYEFCCSCMFGRLIEPGFRRIFRQEQLVKE